MSETHMLIPKRKRLRDKPYTDSYAHAECVVPGCATPTYGVVGAHIRWNEFAGASRKPDDDLTLPLCFSHHADQEDFPGPSWWVQNVLKPMARNRYQEWKDG